MIERATRDVDVLVVGVGAAGLAAALAARKAGVSVLCVGAGEGASGVATGTWELGTDGAVAPVSDRRTLAALLGELAQRWPAHPLGGRSVATRVELEELLDALVTALPGLVGPGLDAERPLAVTELGLFRRPGLVQREVLDLAPLARARVAVARLAGLPSFDARFIAASLDEIAVEAGDPRRFAAIDVDLDLGVLDVEAPLVDLARRLDGAPAREELAGALARALGSGVFDAVLVPPVLGLEATDVRHELEERLGVRVGEATATLGGPQASRWSAALARALETCGATRRHAEVSAVEIDRDAIAVTLRDLPTELGGVTDGIDVTLRARAVVLATGTPSAGHLATDDGLVREPLAGLPICDRGARRGPRAEGRGAARVVPEPMAEDELAPHAGVAVDREMRPRMDDDEILSDRLFGCGALLADIDVTGPGSGRIGAALSGWLAGRVAARRILERPSEG